MKKMILALVSAAAAVLAAGCATEVASSEQTSGAAEATDTAELAERDNTSHAYEVSIDNFWVTYPRSKNTDTVTAAISVVDGYTNVELVHSWQFAANVHDGGVNVNFARTFAIANWQVVKIGVGLENFGIQSLSRGEVANVVVRAEQSVSEFGLGQIWPVYNEFSRNVGLGFGQGGCDGIVAGDGAVLYGSQLESLTANGPYTRTIMFPGTDSAGGCGRNSLYYMTWTIRRAA